MHKKTILIIVVVGIFGLLSYLGYNVISKTKDKNQIAKQLEIIPDFEFLSIEQQPFAKSDLKQGIQTIFIYFNSECDFCKHEAQSINNNLDNFKNVQFIFVSTEPIEIIKQFAEQYTLSNQPNITFLYDNLSTFSSQFDANSIPYLLIYDQNQKLIKKHKGQINAKGILRVLQQND